MATKTIGLDQEAYERLSAAKHDDESFSEAVKRLTSEVMSEWQYGFGRFAEDTEGAEAFTEAIGQAREDRAAGTAASHDETLDALGIDVSDHYTSDPDSTNESP